jgi:acetamidase/formamidase
MCAGDDYRCPQFELHRSQLMADLDVERRGFLKSAFAATGGAAALQTIYEKSSVDLALKDAFSQDAPLPDDDQGADRLTEDEAISVMSIAVDFGVTQVVDGNWGVHAVMKKSLFAGAQA